MLKIIKNLTHYLLCFTVVLFANKSIAQGFTIEVYNGHYFGPGEEPGVDQHGDKLNNVVFTGPLNAVVPFFNNAELEPNVQGERDFGDVDGLLSDGKTKINENVDAAFTLHLFDAINSEVVDVMVAVVDGGPLSGNEIIKPDLMGNMTANIEIAWDYGQPDKIIRDHRTFTTGIAVVPQSLKSQIGMSGGQDQAGDFPAGTPIIGRFGDFDQNGLLDGTFVAAGNTPLELPGGDGNPDLLLRKWVSDIPVPAESACFAEVNGIVANYELILNSLIQSGQYDVLVFNIAQIIEKLDYAILNTDRFSDGAKVKKILTKVKHSLQSATTEIDLSEHWVKQAFRELKVAHSKLQQLNS